jgi:hypothetical protein
VSDTKKGAAAAQPPDSSKFETSPAIPAASVLPIPADSLTVLVIEEGLSFRAAPNLSAARLKSLSLNTALVTLEGGAVAKSKVGVNGQWLHVQDSTGLQGYVAAWYVADKKASIPAASIPAAAAVTAVTPTENNVMFRTKPLVSAETQIRQLASTETLTLLDAPALVTARLGKQGEWMKVRDAQNKEGYVAAWLLKAAATSAASPAEQPISSMAVTARTTADQVALRNQPKVADNNLIKRLPQGSIVTITETGGAEKIGKQDQWVRVKDAQGVEGYLAAWYLAR